MKSNLSPLQRRKLFIVINKAKAKAKKHPSAKQITERLNKALGILQHHEYYQAEKEQYMPTQTTCNCKDWEFHNSSKRQYTGPCKHMTAEILLHRSQMITYQQMKFDL